MKFKEVMLGKRMDSADEIVDRAESDGVRKIVVDYKLDGIRAQIHKDGDKIMIYSRNEKTYNHQFPELLSAVKKLRVKQIIFEGEIVAVNSKGRVLPFQFLSRRTRRLEDVSAFMEKIPIRMYVFDVLEYNYKNIERTPLIDRVHYVKEISESNPIFRKVPSIVVPVNSKTAKEIEEFSKKSISDGNEGVMVKNAYSYYQEGKRSFDWMKLKPQFRGGLTDTIDCAVIGADYGKGKRKGVYGSFLIGVKHKNDFTPVGRVGSGFTDEDLINLTKKLGDGKKNGDYSDVEFPKPKIVLEVYAEEITKSPKYPLGLGLRFPKVKTIRNDKNISDVSTFKDLESLYNSQPSVKQKDKSHRGDGSSLDNWF